MTQSAIVGVERLRRPALLRTVQLGDTAVSFVPDGAVQLTPRGWLPDTTDETWARHPEYLDGSGNLVGSIGGLLIERGDRALLIDAGFGPRAWPAEPGNAYGAISGGALVQNLARLGRRPEDIETVAFTHLHIEHVGWAWHPGAGGAPPVFAHADYLVAEPEWAQRELLEQWGTSKEVLAALAPRVRPMRDGAQIFPGVRARITGGHTPGHAQFVVTAGDERLIAFGDTLHSPIQIGHPEWSAAADHDRIHAAKQRHRLIAELEQTRAIAVGGHFADVVFGQVRRVGSDRVWRPL